MKCPRCGVLLNEIKKAGVLVDVCDQCLGMWLDRGELEKIVARIREIEGDLSATRGYERGASPSAAHPANPYPADPRYAPYPPRHHDEDHDHDEHHGYQKRKGWRGMLDIFD